MKRTNVILCAAIVSTAAIAACNENAIPNPDKAASTSSAAAATSAAPPMEPLPAMPKAEPLPPTPKGLPEMKIPADNALTPEKAMLGKQLFFDKRLSGDGSASCETCHVPEKGWTDGEKFSKKVGGGMNTRHSPTLINVGYNDLWYWDGRATTLEKQVEAAWKGQMGAADEAKIAAEIQKIPLYEVEFKAVFDGPATPDNIVKAIASFVRTIRVGDAPWDKFENGDKNAASKDAQKGFEIFRNKAACAACHAPTLYTDNGFHNVGIGSEAKDPDPGREKVTKDKKDEGAFMTPNLRNVDSHPPYFHDGRAATLDDAVDLMLAGGVKNPNLDAKLKPVKLSKDERSQLMAFLKALDTQEPAFERPKLP